MEGNIFLNLYVDRILSQLKNTKIIKRNSNFAVVGEGANEMLTIVDYSEPNSTIKEFEVTIENNNSGKKFADFANARLFGLKNSEVSTYYNLQSLGLPPYQLKSIKFTKRFNYNIAFEDDFKNSILG